MTKKALEALAEAGRIRKCDKITPAKRGTDRYRCVREGDERVLFVAITKKKGGFIVSVDDETTGRSTASNWSPTIEGAIWGAHWENLG